MWRWGKLEVVLSGSLTGQYRLEQRFASWVDCSDRGVPAVAAAAVVAAEDAAAAAEDAAAAAADDDDDDARRFEWLV